MPRCVFVMQSASDDVAEDRIVWTCCKNNDGELGDRSAWIRCNGLFDPVSDFDWDAWNSDGQAVKIGIEIVQKSWKKAEVPWHAIFCVTKSKGKASPDEPLIAELKKRRNSGLSSSRKEKTPMSCINCARIVPWHDRWHREMTNQQTVPVAFPIGGVALAQ